MCIGRHSENMTLPLAYPFWPVKSKQSANFEKNHVHCLWLLLINQVVKFQIKPILDLPWTNSLKLFGEYKSLPST